MRWVFSFMENFQVYVLISLKHGRYYTGMSSDPVNRLEFHNSGLNTSTRSGIPWKLAWFSERMVKDEALRLERKVKKRGAGRFLSDMSGGHA